MPRVRGLPGRLVDPGRCLVMGVVNVTPDSFSDGGRWFEPQAAIAHGRALAAEGADLLDIGGESTRPGAQRVPIEEELRRVLPVVRQLADDGMPVSVDTMRAEVADAALSVGACLVNDVSGGLADAGMAGLVADSGVPFVAMHWRAPSDEMERRAVYDDVVVDVVAELTARLDGLVAAGVDPEQVILDLSEDARRTVGRWTGAYQYVIGTIIEAMAARCRHLGLRSTLPLARARQGFTTLLTVATMKHLHSGRHRLAL